VKHLFIINPIAGGKNRHFEKTKEEIQRCVEKLKDPFEIYMTKGPLDATNKIKEAAQSDEKIYVYACGGDGTLNECVNAAVNRENVVVTHFPCGTGNDFIKTFGKENAHKFCNLESLIAGEVRALDIIDCDGRYGVNICSVGIDARVANDVHKYSKIPVIGGAAGYVVALLANIIKGVKQNVKITYDDVIHETPTTLICACNGRFYGGGFNPVPDAIPDDGIIDFLIVDGVSRLKIAQIVGKYADGKYKELRNFITHIRGTEMLIEGNSELTINIDGEIIKADKISFKLIPKGVKFLFPKGM